MADFHVPDMSCEHCVGVIRAALERGLPGAAVAIDLARHRVHVEGEAARAESLIREAGYEPHAL